MASTSVRFMTFNVWDIPVSKHRAARIKAIAQCLRANADGADVIGLIECWLQADRDALIAAAREGGLAYHVFFRNGCGFPGGQSTGLVVLSRWPITDAMYRRFSAAGKAQKLLHWDYSLFSGKGIGKAEICIPDVGLCDVFISHFVAYYTPRPEDPASDEYALHRHLAAWEAGRFIRATRRANAAAICLTDLNAAPDTLTYEAVRALAGLRDAWADAGRARQSLSPASDKWDKEAERLGLTVNYPGNRYHESNPWTASGEPSARIDFVLYSAGTLPLALEWCERRHAEEEILVGGNDAATMSLSDHAAVLASFRITAPSENESTSSRSIRSGSRSSRSSSRRSSDAESVLQLQSQASDGASSSLSGSTEMLSSNGDDTSLSPPRSPGIVLSTSMTTPSKETKNLEGKQRRGSWLKTTSSAGCSVSRLLLERLLASANAGVKDARARRRRAMHKARFFTLLALLSAFMQLLLHPFTGLSGATVAVAQTIVCAGATATAVCMGLLAHVNIPDEESGFIAFRDNAKLVLASSAGTSKQ